MLPRPPRFHRLAQGLKSGLSPASEGMLLFVCLFVLLCRHVHLCMEGSWREPSGDLLYHSLPSSLETGWLIEPGARQTARTLHQARVCPHSTSIQPHSAFTQLLGIRTQVLIEQKPLLPVELSL